MKIHRSLYFADIKDVLFLFCRNLYIHLFPFRGHLKNIYGIMTALLRRPSSIVTFNPSTKKT